MHLTLHAKPSRVGHRPGALLALLCVLVLSAPAGAHQEQKKQQRSEEVQRGTATDRASSMAMPMHEKMGEVMDEAERNRSSMPFSERLVDWLGRLHPTIVHFPIAFFPAALFTALVGRRRPTFAIPVQFLVVAGGIVAPIAAVLGWLDALSADPGLLLTVHRWLGTTIGLAGLVLAIWAWHRPEQVRGLAMIVVLSFITAAIVVQGWYGGALVHGIEHLNW